MPIEVRLKASDGDWLAITMIVCCHCGEEIECTEEAKAIWLADGSGIPGKILVAEYAHEGCEDRHLSRFPEGHAKAAKQMHRPLKEFFDELRGV